MKLNQTLTKENFWNAIFSDYPKACQIFCDWIDEYKKSVEWDAVFRANEICIAPKFHEIPYEMQQGIWITFVVQTLPDFFEQPEYQYSGDLEEDIKEVFAEIEKSINEE